MAFLAIIGALIVAIIIYKSLHKINVIFRGVAAFFAFIAANALLQVWLGVGSNVSSDKQQAAVEPPQIATKIDTVAVQPSLDLRKPEGVSFPSSNKDEKSKYYLLGSQKVGDIYQTRHKRVGVDSVTFIKTEINCSSMKYRLIGISEESVDAIVDTPTEWMELVNGSIKADLARFVCKKSLGKFVF
ncbi:MAG: hypothetical protein ACRCV6_00740 [Formosimonas sp.]